MAETSKIAVMAEKVSDEIFEVFGWDRVLPSDQNWACVDPDHENETHPSDVVFRYRHPYRAVTVHLTTDLKSFAKDSITKQQISKALRSLVKSATCAAISQEWQDLYAAPDSTLDVAGLLFVYNHDGEYGGDFKKLLIESDATRTGMPASTVLYVIGPSRVSYLATVANDILRLRGTGKLPPKGEHFWFFYPDLIGEHARADQARAATIETLCGPLIVCRYIDGATSAAVSGALVYYARTGKDPDEFKYLLDYLFRYQLISNCDEVRIRLASSADNATAVFQRAVTAYLADFNDLPEVRARLKRVKLETVTSIVKVFSEVALGMERL
jgi:hypothetical protein